MTAVRSAKLGKRLHDWVTDDNQVRCQGLGSFNNRDILFNSAEKRQHFERVAFPDFEIDG